MKKVFLWEYLQKGCKLHFNNNLVVHYIVNPSPLGWIVINLLTICLICYIFPLKNSLKHKKLFSLKANVNSKNSRIIKYTGIAAFLGGLIGIWYNFEGFYQLLFFFELENENLKTLWSLQVSVSSVITGMLLLLIYVINLAMVCENGIYIVSKFNLFYMYFIKREDLEIVKIEKMKF
ncbi:hypothetical protein DLL31_05545, partial [Campylobacter jejuni]|nr:hypothetical protein [Campylobacter jejuni]EAI9737127.1 hypothetical protein [Campylobacter jejuni]EAJ3311242.1 hypothetical protein [Campylobacter jejuni]EAL1436773.1 hypothetical protein [Campylobacter jejuni]EFQ8125669.1 hypothetical protein [Campylobacter jejuni]